MALALGFSSGLFRLDLIPLGWVPLLLSGLLVSTALIEEVLFRGLLIPRLSLERGWGWTGLAMTWSTGLYVLWHPLSAITRRPEAQALFLAPSFLGIVALLGSPAPTASPTPDRSGCPS